MSEQIEVLSNRDKVRERINVFHDSSSNWINLIKELIGNSLDAFDKDSTNNVITIDIIDNQQILYTDNAKGIPLEGKANNGMPNYVAICEVDFGGSRYGYVNATIGQNGVFIYSLAMTSEDIEIEVGRPNGKVYKVAYHKGNRLYDLKEIGTTDKTYTKILFKPDDEVWTNVNYTFEEISEICKNQSAMGNVLIKLTDVKKNKQEEYYCKGLGIKSLFEDNTKNKNFIADPIYFTDTIDQYVEKKKQAFPINTEMIIQFSNDSKEDYKKNFLNTADLINFGKLHEGVILGLKTHFNKYLKVNNKYTKNETQIKDEDVELGLNYICNAKSPYAEYVSQSKQKVDALHYRDAMKAIIEKYFEIFTLENPLQVEKIANQILINKRSREKANETRKNIKKKLTEKVDGINNRIEGLVDCRTYGEDSELFIVEGLSALGSLVASRNSKNQACFPIRGKILSTLKVNYDKILSNDLIMKIINCLGCGIEVNYKKAKLPPFDINKLRYGKVIIATDADADGENITCLLLTMMYRLLPTLIKEGRIYKVRTPLYEITYEDKTIVYAFNETEYATLMKGHNAKKCKIQRAKGLGEQNAEEMHKFAMNSDTRYIYKITVDDVERMEEHFEKWMATDTTVRKGFIEENLYKYVKDID